MKKQVLLMMAMLLMAVNGAMAQAPNIQWAKCYGGSAGEEAHTIQQTTDGGYIVAGSSGSNDGDVTGHHGSTDSIDYWVVKFSSTGSIQWQQSYGGSGSDDAESIQQTTDGGYIIVGGSTSNDGDVSGHHGSVEFEDYWIVKISSNGTLQWQKSLGGTDDDHAYSIQQTTDGGYIVAGKSSSNDGDVTGNHLENIMGGNTVDYWIVKISSNGTLQWQKSLGGSGSEVARSIQQTSDGGYIVAGMNVSNDGDITGNHGYYDFWVIKLNAGGSIQWQKSLGGTAGEAGFSIKQTIDGGYIVAGNSRSNDGDVTGNHGYADYWIVKLNATGNIQWQKNLGGTDEDFAFSIQQTTDGGYIVAGDTFSNDDDVSGNHTNSSSWVSDYWIVKLNATGSIQWQKPLGGTGYERAYFIQQTTDGGYIMAGVSTSNNGDVTGSHGNSDCWVVKLAKDPVGVEELPTSSISLSPNPTTGIITITGITQPSVAVYNLMGQKVVAAQGSNEVSLAQLPAGLYMVQVFSKDGALVKWEKVIKE